MVTCTDDGETKVPTTINLDDIKVKIDKEHSPDIKLDDELTLRMRYPSMEEFIKTNFSTTENLNVDDTFKLIASCIDQIYSEEESWAGSDCTDKELSEFIESLSSQQFKQIEKFFDTMPKMTHTVKVTNPKTKKQNKIVLEGLQSFFM